MPSSTSASDAVSGISRRIVSPYMPQLSSTRPSSSARAVTRFAAAPLSAFIEAAAKASGRPIGDYAARLARISGHPVSMAGAGGNFVVLVLSEDERRAIGPRVAELIPGIPRADLASDPGLGWSDERKSFDCSFRAGAYAGDYGTSTNQTNANFVFALVA